MKTNHYYYNENTKCNSLDCQYPTINKKAIDELVHNSVAHHICINIYNANGIYLTHWTYEVSFGGVRSGEDYNKGKEARLQHHIKKIIDYIKEDYTTYCEEKTITDDVMRRELINEWHFNYAFVQGLDTKELKRIYELGPVEYQEEIEEQERQEIR